MIDLLHLQSEETVSRPRRNGEGIKEGKGRGEGSK